MELVIAILRFFIVWKKKLQWGKQKLQYDSIIGEEWIADDVNKLTEGVLKIGDNQVERDGNNWVGYTRKDESDDKECGERYKNERKQLILVSTELDDKVWMDKNQVDRDLESESGPGGVDGKIDKHIINGKSL